MFSWLFRRKNNDGRDALNYARDQTRQDRQHKVLQQKIDVIQTREREKTERLITKAINRNGTRLQRMEREIQLLDKRFNNMKKENEALAQMNYRNWLIDTQKEREYALKYGVAFEKTGYRRMQDEIFFKMQKQYDREALQTQKIIEEIGHNKVRDLEYSGKYEEAAQVQEATDAAVDDVVVRLQKALAGDFA